MFTLDLLPVLAIALFVAVSLLAAGVWRKSAAMIVASALLMLSGVGFAVGTLVLA